MMSATIAANPAQQTRFERLATEWKRQSRHLSNSAQMAVLRSYQHIIGMGWDAVPLLLREMAREPDQWFWALEAITEENPVPQESRGHVREATEAWLAWGRERGLVDA